MIRVQHMSPFFTKVSNGQLRLVFAYKYLSITKEDELFHFIPIEGKEIVISLDKMQVVNLSEVFVFQRGQEFIRLPLYQLLLVSNMHEHLMPIIKTKADGEHSGRPSTAQLNTGEEVDDEALKIVSQIEEVNLRRLIDESLDSGDEELFLKLSSMLTGIN